MTKWKRSLLSVLFITTLALLFTGLGYATFAGLPAIESIPEHLNQPSIHIIDRNGISLYDILPETGGRHAVLSSRNIPDCMRLATIAVEDRNFYSNPGVDLEGMLRALYINLQGGETIAGGSTITQQLARSLLLQDEISTRTLRRKLRESWLAWQITRSYSKNEILDLYLNQTFYGGFAYGIEAAAQTYFAKPASQLLIPECALLAGLPQAPATYNPFDHPEAAHKRQLIVLDLMEKNGFITPSEHEQALQTPLSYNTIPFPIRAPHFIWMVKNQLDELSRTGQINLQSSMVIRTSLDINAQTLAENAVAHQIAKFKNDNRLDHHVNNAAVVVLDPRKGEILALVGSAGYFNPLISGALNMATASRQPGSAFKPFIYAAAFDPNNPQPWTAATPVLDVQTIFSSSDGQPYIPQNYDEKEHGPVSARVALASSLNIPAVATLQKVGLAQMTRLAAKLGINTLQSTDQYELSLALGGGEVNLLELTGAYGALANLGFLPAHNAILEIRNADGSLLYQPTKTPQPQVFDPRVAWLISDILNDDNARILGFGKNSTLKIERPAAVKTGTTTNYHDNWAIGYTPSLVVGVWVGNSDYQSMRSVNGLTGAAPIWQETLRGLLRGQPVEDFVRPEGLLKQSVCSYSGLLPTPLCNNTLDEWFIKGTQPTLPDNIYRQLWLDSNTGSLATSETPASNRQALIVLDLPPQAQRWAHSQGLHLLSDYTASINPSQKSTGTLLLISPQPRASYHITNKMERSAQQIPIQALVGSELRDVTLWIDGELATSFSSPPYIIWWSLTPGTHHIWLHALDFSGKLVTTKTIEITVTN